LLTGPVGSGKTATLLALCKQLKIEVVEWSNEMEIVQEGNGQQENEIRERSQLDAFNHFLRSADCSPLTSSNHRRLILVEHLPNVFYCNIPVLHECMANAMRILHSALVLILSTVESTWHLNPHRIFPGQALIQLWMENIQFNSCAVTFLMKAMKRVVSNGKIRCTGMDLKKIAESANGDIRTAMQNLRLCTGGGSRVDPSLLFDSFDSIDFFHLIGKVLYSKRSPSIPVCEEQLRSLDSRHSREEQLGSLASRHSRFRPKSDSDPNAIIDLTHTSGNKLAEFLHENEPEFSGTIHRLFAVEEDLSFFDGMSGDWRVSQHPIADEYCSQIAVRSIMFNNYQTISESKKGSSRGLYKMRHPRSREANRRRDQKADTLAQPGLSLSTIFNCFSTFHSRFGSCIVSHCHNQEIEADTLKKNDKIAFTIEESDGDEW